MPARGAAIAFLLLGVASVSCSTRSDPRVRSFEVDRDFAEQDLKRMRSAPVPLERPVVVLSGYRAWPRPAERLADHLARATSGSEADVLAVSYALQGDIESIAHDVIDLIEKQWPSHDPSATVEVDVVAISMGGLVARTAALPLGELYRSEDARTRRLRIARLFTLSTPHRGAAIADRVAPDQAALDMQPGSAFLVHLDRFATAARYAIVPYVHVNDGWVGAENAVPPGTDPIWTEGPLGRAHFTVDSNDLILADIARRLRGEQPIGLPAPLPAPDALGGRARNR